jgi:serine/threonine-protein kinase
MGTALGRKGAHGQAMAHLERARALLEKGVGVGHPLVATNRNNVGDELARVGRHAEAIQQFQQALAIDERVYGTSHRNIAVSLVGIGESRLDLGKAAEAVAPLERAVAILSADPANPRLAQARRALSRATRQR